MLHFVLLTSNIYVCMYTIIGFFLFTNFNLFSLLQSEMTSSHIWNKICHLYLTGVATLLCKVRATAVFQKLALLHCALSLAAQCIVIGLVCVFATGGRYVGLLPW